MSHLIPFFELHPYISLFIMILVEEIGVFLPFPGDAALLLFGVWSRQGRVDFVSTLLIVCLATMIGSTILYYVSRWLGTVLLTKYARLLRYLHITQENVDMIEQWMAKYGMVTLILARLTPGLRIVGTVAAGVLGVPFRVFFPATLVGTIIWTSIYYALGSLLGRKYAEQIDALLSNRMLMVEIMVVGVVIWVVVARYGLPIIKRRFSSPAKTAE